MSKKLLGRRKKLFLACNGQNLFGTVEKSLVTAGLQKIKKMPHFDCIISILIKACICYFFCLISTNPQKPYAISTHKQVVKYQEMHCDEKCILFEEFGRRGGTLHRPILKEWVKDFYFPFYLLFSLWPLSAWAAKMRELGDRNSWRPTSEGEGEYNICHIYTSELDGEYNIYHIYSIWGRRGVQYMSYVQHLRRKEVTIYRVFF